MIKTRQALWISLLLCIALVVVACGGGQPSGGTGGSNGETNGDSDTNGGSGSGQVAVTSAPTLSSGEVQGIFYAGEVIQPYVGKAAYYVHFDNNTDLLVAVDGKPELSLIMHGILEGQSVDAVAEQGKSRAAGRVTTGGFEFNIAIPGRGNLRTRMAPVEQDGGMYIGTFNDFKALFAIFPDGSTAGLAVTQGGDDAVFAFLCVDSAPEGLPDTITATICDTGEEVELTRDID